MANTNNTRKTFTNLAEPQQIRELNRQMEWLWHNLLGGLTEKAFSKAGVKQIITSVQNEVATNLQADEAHFDLLTAALATFVVGRIAVADLDFATVRDFVSEAMILEQGVANSLYIKNLVATEANILHAVLHKLIVKGTDNKYYNITVTTDGILHTEDVTDDVDPQTDTIIEPDVPFNAETVNAHSYIGSEAIISSIFARALTVGELTATQATLASAVIPELYVTAIKSLGDSIDISANQSINMVVQDITNTNANFRRFVRLMSDGVHIGDSESSNELLLDSESVNVLINGILYSKFGPNYVQFGDYQLRRTSDGGLAFMKRV